MKKTWMVVLLGCAVGFSGGYWLNWWVCRKEARAGFVRSVSWAIEQGLLTVDTNRLSEIASE